ncbi:MULTISPECIES: oligogalacturonate-specific porin KdgM family protein [Vibrio]|uniref:oligogalacturonate-specific porin KdgM family protein n=1 Tax=Vibrio TaxID=662 RepID=UPI000BFFCD00|nr:MULTISPECIES: oligogalacturonate-specific porin KdgM family protein [unclassified Vibrio]PHJ41948.1 porin [Vibrio sp. PID17_43]RIZ56059.1 porin [Vibrio sp. PID23_8]
MKNVLALSAFSLVFASSAFAGSSYVTGNVQFHSDFQPNVTSTLEAGHTFDTGTTLLTEFDGISLGKYDDNALQDTRLGYSPYITLGIEQSYSFNDNLWVAAGYHHLLNNGETVQYRPLVKIGYYFDNGIAISNRTRYHDVKDGNDQLRFDNRIGYVVNEELALSYNNVYVRTDNADNTMDHELRATWIRNGVQPYFEYRNQADNANNAFVFGASYGF